MAQSTPERRRCEEQESRVWGTSWSGSRGRVRAISYIADPRVVNAVGLAFLNGHGPRVAESGLTLIAGHPYSAPYEDLRLKGK
jgi:hypothetical protein